MRTIKRNNADENFLKLFIDATIKDINFTIKAITELKAYFELAVNNGNSRCSDFKNISSTFSDTNIIYLGAFSRTSDHWLEGWTEFDPQNADY